MVPKGTVLVEVGKLLAKGTPMTDENGKLVRDKNGKVVYEPYKIKVLNTINFKKSMHYNPFVYIRSEKDILKLVTTIIANTRMILSILVDTFISKISLPMQPVPEIRSISGA